MLIRQNTKEDIRNSIHKTRIFKGKKKYELLADARTRAHGISEIFLDQVES